ncbi:MAG: hypothetical protein VB032_09615 [Burkholderiaceae bacterium]|nr:hypothetical protein [Burkholderiaceae bacterium]
MDRIITYFKKNPTIGFITIVMFPIACALIYGGIKSLWLRKKSKQNSIAIYEFLVKSGADQTAKTTDEIAKALNISKNDVIALCSEHAKIADAGKRQRSWKLKTEEEEKEEAKENEKNKQKK